MVREDPVAEYLQRLEDAASSLPDDRGRELVRDVREHISVIIEQQSQPLDEAEKLNILERLGSPDEIVRAAYDEAASDPVPPHPQPRTGSTQIVGLTTVLLLLLGGLVFGIGWIVGLMMLWTTPLWTRRDRLIGTWVVPGGLGLPFWLYLTETGSAQGSSLPWWLAVLALLAVLSFVTAGYLTNRIRTLSGRTA